MRRSSYPTSGYSLGARRTQKARRLLAFRQRPSLAKPFLLLAAFLVLGTSALASTGTHKSGHAPPAARATPGAQARPVTTAGGVRIRAAPPAVKLHAFSGTWLAAHPVSEVPSIRGQAAIVVDLDAGQILFALDPHARLADASLTKMMTAMIALDLAAPDQVLTVPAAATQVVPDHMGLTAGEQLAVRELLDGMLLDSGNDAAETLAQALVPRDQFIDRMNRKAQAMRLRDTHFVNPSGLDDSGHYSSAYDLAVMAATLLLDYPDLRTIAGTRQVTLPATATHKWFRPTSLNRLLATYPGAIGVKPGYTDDAGYCLAAAATRSGHTVIAVVLGSTQHFTDATTLLDFGFRHLASP